MNSKPISPSALNRRITLQYQTKVSNGMGSFTVSWADAATVWAKAWTVSSAEGLGGMQTTMTRIQKFLIRFRSVLKPSWRVKWGERYFNIVSIDPDETNSFLFLTVKEAV